MKGGRVVKQKSSHKLRVLDLFSGIGGITMALKGLADTVAYCEIYKPAQRVLEARMADGTLDKAPIFEDVTKLTVGDIVRTKGVARKPVVDMIVGGWPCQDLSPRGLRRGVGKGTRSGLIREILRLLDETGAGMALIENVPAVRKMGMDLIFEEFVQKRGFELRWGVVAASTVGAHHVRERFFGLAVKPGFDVSFIKDQIAAYKRFDWSKPAPPRMVPHEDRLKFDRANRHKFLGNSVVPDAVRAAFLSLLSAYEHDPVDVLGVKKAMALQPVDVGGKMKPMKEDAPVPKWGYATRDVKGNLMLYSLKTQFKPVKPHLQLSFDPKKFQHPAAEQFARQHTSPRVLEAVPASGWATPRRGLFYATRVLSERTTGDLPTQLRFQVATPDHLRSGQSSARFVEWLMGYPVDYTLA
jgi:hypothetical protein